LPLTRQWQLQLAFGLPSEKASLPPEPTTATSATWNSPI